MLAQLLWFEIRNRLCKTSSIVYFCLFLSISFFLSILFADAFQGMTIGFGSSKLALNSPININRITASIGYIGILVIAPIFGRSIYKDFETEFRQILFTTPISKRMYFFIRFFGSYIVVLAILSSAGLGIWLATHMPFINQSLVIKNNFSFYISPYLLIILPNMLFLGSLFIAIASSFKKMSPIYIASVVLFMVHATSGIVLVDMENRLIAALMDPLGSISVQEVTRYWSVAEQNSKVIPLTGYLLYNRLLWMGIGSLLLFLGYRFFNPFKNLKEKKSIKTLDSHISILEKPKVTQKSRSLKGFLTIAISELRQAFSDIYFLIILLCGVLFLFMCSFQVGKFYGTETLPVTYQVLEGIGGSFQLFMVILITYYAGELVWKERDKFFYEITDAKPVSNFFLYSSKLVSLVFLQVIFCFTILITCLVIQIFNGYYFFEWSVYFQHLFRYLFLPNILVCVFALFIQTVSKNKYIGHSIIVSYYILIAWLPSLGFDHNLYLIGNVPASIYSDMNKFGSSFYPFIMFTLFWGVFHFGLACFTVLIWMRGAIGNWKDRLGECKTRIQPFYKIAFSGTLCCWIFLGSFIFYNTNVLNTYKTKSSAYKEAVSYEVLYKKFEQEIHPEITSVFVNVDLHPENHGMSAEGKFKYRNNSNEAIRTVLLNIAEEAYFSSLEWDRKALLATDDVQHGVRIFELEEPLQPNEEIQLSFQLEIKSRGFANSGFLNKIFENGTFFYGTDYFPAMGYMAAREIASDKVRRKYGLPDKPDMLDINDKEAVNGTYLSQEGSWIDFEAIVSTLKDQIAVAPGYLMKEWEEGNRRFFHYKMDQPMLNFYAFLSGRYEVAVDHWNDVKIEIFHHPTHTYNVARMIHTVKKSLDYYTQNFSPYQFNQVRIIEFPRYVPLAQSFPNTIPYSESVGFIAKIKADDPECIDYVFYITAHEVAHQWWAHQVIGGNVQGATMLSESLAQYSALMVQEKEYGPKQMQKFLKYEMDTYLAGRGRESKKEMPLMLNTGQQYIHYNKGSVIFYALKDYLGEEVVNTVLREYIQDVAFQKPPFTRSIDLVERFKKVTPADKQYLIEDFFEKIVLYSNCTESATFSKVGDKYEVVVTSNNKKFESDDLGNEQEVSMNDFVDVGVFDEDGNILYLEKHRAQSGNNVFHIQVEKMPHKAGVDPINKLIDKDPKSHLVKAVEAAASYTT